VATYLRETPWRDTLTKYQDMYESRAKAMIAGLEQHMPDGVRWNTPEGGFYVWVTLPEGADSYELCMSAIDKGVVFVPGTAFYTDGRGANEARLSFCHPTEEKIAEGTRILGEVFTEALG